MTSIPSMPSAPSIANAPDPTAPAPGAPQAATTRYNVLSLISIVVVSMNPILGVVLAHIGFGQVRRTGERGRGLAITALALGYGIIALTVAWVVLVIVGALLDPEGFRAAFDSGWSGDSTSYGYDPNDYSDSGSRTGGGYSSDDEYDY